MATGQTISSEKIYATSAELELEPGEYICQAMAYNSSGSLVDSSRKNYVNTCMSEDEIYADPLCKIYPKEQYSWGVYRLLVTSCSGISIEIYDSKSKAWQDYSIDAWEGGFIDLSEIKNGAACTIKISASEESSTPDGSIG